MINYGISSADARILVATLTLHQRRVAEQIAMGMPTSEIATHLGITVNSIRHTAFDIRRKLKTPMTYGIGRIWFAALDSAPR